MKAWTKIYMEFFGYGIDDVVLCENCSRPAVDIHHIKERSQGGKHNIENLIALCRSCHNAVHNEKISEVTLKYMHKCKMNDSERILKIK